VGFLAGFFDKKIAAVLAYWHERRRLILVLTVPLVYDNVQAVQKPQ